MRKGRLKGRSGQPALTFFPTASVGPSVLSTCISKPGPSGRPIRKKSPVDSLIDPLLTLPSFPPCVRALTLLFFCPLRSSRGRARPAGLHAPAADVFGPPPIPRGLRLVAERGEIRVFADRHVVRCQEEGEG